MSGAGKVLKMSSLAAMFVGIATLIVGIVINVGATVLDIDALATIGEGLIAAVYGVRTAILANVPSNTQKIRNKAIILLVFAAAVIGYFVYRIYDVTVPQLVLAGVVGAIGFCAVIVANGIIKEQLRK